MPATLRAATLCAALAASPALAGPIGTNIIQNGTFDQSSPFAANSQFGSAGYANLPGWTVTAANGSTPFDLWFIASTATSVGAQSQYGSTNQFLRGAPSGAVSADFVGLDGSSGQAQGVLSQGVSNLNVGDTYQLTFQWAGAQLATGSGSFSVALAFNLGASALTSTTGAPITSTFSGSQGSYSAWNSVTYTFTATASNEVLSFLATGTTGTPPFVLLDGVSLVDVPEPSSLAVIAAGLGTILLLQRRRATHPAPM